MTLQNLKKIKSAADKNGLKMLCVNKALMPFKTESPRHFCVKTFEKEIIF